MWARVDLRQMQSALCLCFNDAAMSLRGESMLERSEHESEL